MGNKIIVFILTLFLLSGCASMFTIGNEDFACKGNEAGGKCGDPVTIYKNREKILKEGNKVKDEKNTKDETKNIKMESFDTLIPMPVRRTEEIIRVYINSFKDHKGNLIGNIWTFTVVNDGDWLLPDGRRIVNVE